MTSYSIEIRPGPVIKRLIQMAIISKSNSYPPTNPFDNLTCNVLPIISKTTKPAAILVKIPNKIAKPPATSSKAIKTARSGAILSWQRNPEFQEYLKLLEGHAR